MLNENGDAVGLVIELQKKIFIAQLRESAFGQALVSAQAAQGFLEISGANLVVHGIHLNGGSGMTEKLSTARLQQLLPAGRIELYSATIAASRGAGRPRIIFRGDHAWTGIFRIKKVRGSQAGPGGLERAAGERGF